MCVCETWGSVSQKEDLHYVGLDAIPHMFSVFPLCTKTGKVSECVKSRTGVHGKLSC